MRDGDDLMGQVRAAWAQTLGCDIEQISPDVGFFEAGGDSLLLLLLCENLNELTPRQLRPTDLFQHASVRGQAALLRGDS